MVVRAPFIACRDLRWADVSHVGPDRINLGRYIMLTYASDGMVMAKGTSRIYQTVRRLFEGWGMGPPTVKIKLSFIINKASCWWKFRISVTWHNLTHTLISHRPL